MRTSDSSVRIVRARLADVRELAPLFDAYRQFYRQRPNRPAAQRFLRRRLRNGESIVFLARLAGCAVGFLQLYPSFDSVALRPVYILYDLYVSPAARRHGVAAQLMERARRQAVVARAGGMILETARTNRAAQCLYSQLGWKRDTEFYRYALRV